MTSFPPSSPKSSPLPPLPDPDPLTPEQWKTLLATADAVIPSIRPNSTGVPSIDLVISEDEYSSAVRVLEGTASHAADSGLIEAYLSERASDSPAFREAIRRLISLYMPQDARRQLAMVLDLLHTRLGSLLLTGYVAPLTTHDTATRSPIVQSWKSARLPTLRLLHRSLTMLFKQSWARTSPTLPPLLGFPRVPVGLIPGIGFPYSFIQFPAGEGIETIETDVVIVGSGCGGGVCAENLAEAGHRVVVVDKGVYWKPEHFPMRESEAFVHMFHNGGVVLSDDASTSVVAGETWGGGGTVNWSASLQTQGYVRTEWAQQGLPFFTSAEFQDSLDRISQRMGVSADYVRHNKTNKLLLEGSRKLGWSAKPVPQNTGGSQHLCGYCTLGCRSCEKQGPAVSFLPDAARAGAVFVEGFDAKEVLFETRKGRKTAVGVKGVWASRDSYGGLAGKPAATREVLIRAGQVVLSAGALQSPLILRRSGFRNHHIGRNLHLHPVCILGAVYDEETVPWEGGILTAVVSEFENLDGQGHGVKLEAVNMIPSSWLPWLPFTGGLDYKLLASRMRGMVGYISLARDRDTGEVYPDPVDGRCRVRYTPSAFDKNHILEGLVALAKIQYVAGAREIFVAVPGVSTFVRSANIAEQDKQGINDTEFQAWLGELRGRGFPSPETIFVSAHQMGTCRMGSSPGTSVVDPRGKVWGAEGLYVADASVFPSASGVNPMVTNMAIADWISRGINSDIKRKATETGKL